MALGNPENPSVFEASNKRLLCPTTFILFDNTANVLQMKMLLDGGSQTSRRKENSKRKLKRQEDAWRR